MLVFCDRAKSHMTTNQKRRGARLHLRLNPSLPAVSSKKEVEEINRILFILAFARYSSKRKQGRRETN